MTTTTRELETTARRPKHGARNALIAGAAGSLALAAALLAVWVQQAGATLDARAAALRAEFVEVRAHAAAPRPVLVGEASPGDAVPRYRALERSWGCAPDSPTRACPTVLIEELEAFVDEGTPPGDAALAMVAGRQPLLEDLRAGLRLERCDWQPDGGIEPRELLSGELVRQVSAVLAYGAAATDEPRVALADSFALLAFASDLQREGEVTSELAAYRPMDLGLRCLELALERLPLTAEDLAEIEQVLTALPMPSFERTFAAQRRYQTAALLLVAGRDVPGLEAGRRRGRLNDLWVASSLAEVDAFRERQFEACRIADPAARGRALEALREELHAAGPFARVLTFGPELVVHSRDDLLARHAALRERAALARGRPPAR